MIDIKELSEIIVEQSRKEDISVDDMRVVIVNGEMQLVAYVDGSEIPLAYL